MKIILWIVVAISAAWATTQLFSIFVIQPIGAVPEGKTILLVRLNTLNFIDSADAWCDRHQGGVNLICRGLVMGKVAQEATIIAKFPYSETLYKISTDGKTYTR